MSSLIHQKPSMRGKLVYASSLRAEIILRNYSELPKESQIFYVFWSNLHRHVGQCQRTLVFRRHGCANGR